ncbi:GNAT family N-acetyltransferase [Rhodoferax sp. UBA5149]|uniref:GNAT family N-acetyltransferase n=1 Tax=Rhodoferax sp. UBA5149 TaxID=1947379 RepID=UPI0025E767AC|nr:GNAT family N-acetyltransferase [Rhodoferax sp. UBA5149]
MPIRFATVQDIAALVEGGRRMHAHTRFKALDYDPVRVAATFRQLIERGQSKYVFMVAEDTAGQMVGALIAVLEQHIFSAQLTASVMHYDVLPEKRMGGYGVRLLKAFEQWCKNRKVVEINLGINSLTEMDRVGQFVRKMGYSKTGENFVKGSL